MATMVNEVASYEVDDRRAVEVFEDQTGTFWMGLTTYHDTEPVMDWTFAPRAQYGTGEVGRRMAEAEAAAWASGLRYDKEH